MIGLDSAVTLIDGSLKHARGLGLQPMTVVVLDAGGCLVALKREDGSSLLRPRIAQAKASGALGMGMGSRALAERVESHSAFMNAIIGLADGMLVPVPGGVLIRSAAGSILGAVGISGDHSDKDEACAVAGIEAAGLIGDTGA
ncbi:MAG TPA: heme-binding protein [Steroidobacteraceae bacterium]